MRRLLYLPLLLLLRWGNMSVADSADVVIVEPFRLPDATGKVVDVHPDQSVELHVVCFLGTECPLAKLYAARLNSLALEYAGSGVRFIGINSNQQDSLEDLRRYVRQHNITFPVVKDFGNVVADQFGAERTPEAFLLDKRFRVRYRGRIDNQYVPGVALPRATEQDLRCAMDELLAGKLVTQPRTAAPGCIIGRRRKSVAASDVTYCRQIARVFDRHCVECHREGEIGPFVLTDYEEAVGWADTVLEVIENGRMPPWHASPGQVDFVNARVMPREDIELLTEWVKAGVPYGDPKQLPPPRQQVAGWRLSREPDLVLEMGKHAFDVPAEGTVEYQYFVVDPGFEEDKWITGAQVIPGNRSVVHHSIVFVRPPDGSRFRGLGWVAAYVPGQQVLPFPTGAALHVPAGSKFVFQQHYTPTGIPQQDLTKVGLLFGDDALITHEVYTIIAIDQEFEIPPGADKHVVRARVQRLPPDAKLLSINPHMHLRGKSFQLFADADGGRRTLLNVPHYDFNWQHSYRLREPLPLASIDKLEFAATFDNSAANPVNPDPHQHVTWGDQTWEEMAVAFFEVYEPRRKQAVPERTSRSPRQDSQPPEITNEIREFMTAQATRMMARFDSNQDGRIGLYETPWVFRRYSFSRIDADRDGLLTREEIEQAARRKAQ